MSTNELAKGRWDDDHTNDDHTAAQCTMLYLHTKEDDDRQTDRAFYGEFCWNFDDDDIKDWAHSDSQEWCDTFRSAVVWIVSIVFGGMLSCMGSCWVSPICVLGRCCCPRGCPRILFVLAMLLCIFGNVMWITNDRVCLGEFGLDIGYSIELAFAACFVMFCASICAK